MAKVILVNGVLNVEESYSKIIEFMKSKPIGNFIFIQLTLVNTNQKISINVSNIQYIKP